MPTSRWPVAVLPLATALGLLVPATGAASPAAVDTCPPPRTRMPELVVLCVDARTADRHVSVSPRGLRFVKPNRHILVQVLHPADQRPAIGLGGEVGAWEAGARATFSVEGPRGDGFHGTGLTGETGSPADEPEAPAMASTESVFAPRRPGALDLTVSFGEGDTVIQQFLVEETYSGVFRVGVAGVMLGAVERPYRAWTAPGSSQQEVAAARASALDLDLVLGYAPYFDEGGRGASGCTSRPLCFNPYFGVGAVGTNASGAFDWIKSVHLGVEWELTPSFSVGLTGTLRRVDRLPAGVFVGAPLDGELTLSKGYALGLGLVVNVSPELLKVGAEGARKVLP